jgi:2-succinyl-5-enolpyruvyl-6-hydroxy-3-cyclohexene-1-carboxylate synthase
MTIITIESDSEETTQLVLKYAQEHGLPAKTDEHQVLTAQDMVTGIGRKATDKELIEYLLKCETSEKINIDEWQEICS